MMAVRRSRPAAQPPMPSIIPERLARCDVEDWVSLAEVADARSKLADDKINGRPMADDVQQVLWELRTRSRGRVRAARRQWAEENGLNADQAHRLITSGGLPRYRDESVFIAEIRRSIALMPRRSS